MEVLPHLVLHRSRTQGSRRRSVRVRVQSRLRWERICLQVVVVHLGRISMLEVACNSSSSSNKTVIL